MDGTYKKKSTRDRAGGPLADRFVVVSALRSEHPGKMRMQDTGNEGVLKSSEVQRRYELL